MKKKAGAIAIKSFALRFAMYAVLGTAFPATAQDATTTYQSMAPVDEYLMADQGAEIALARSAAPESIAGDAEVLVLRRHGFETAVKGKNGFVCIVARSWTSASDSDFWVSKSAGPDVFECGSCARLPSTHHQNNRLDPGRRHASSEVRDHRRYRRQERTAGDGIPGDVLHLHEVEAGIRRRQN